MAKDTRIAFRASEELKDRLQRAAKKCKLGETALAEAAVEATVEYIEKHGGIWFPLQVVPAPQGADFEAAGERPSAVVGDPSSNLTRATHTTGDYRLNEDPPSLPRVHSTRARVKKTVEQKKGKSGS